MCSLRRGICRPLPTVIYEFGPANGLGQSLLIHDGGTKCTLQYRMPCEIATGA